MKISYSFYRKLAKCMTRVDRSSNKMSLEAELKEQLGKTVDTYVKYIDVDTGATVSTISSFRNLWLKDYLKFS